MKKVCLFTGLPRVNFHGYSIETFDPLEYFQEKMRWSLSDFIRCGLNGYDKKRAITAGAAGIDRLYRERDPAYMQMTKDFVERFRDFDLIVMSTYNFIHPEVLKRELKKPIKILGFIDDPLSTYLRGIPYLWAFDGAFYISPSYIDNLNFTDALQQWGCNHSTWRPLVPFSLNKPEQADGAFYSERDIDLVYVGNPTASKVDRLKKLKRYFGARMHVHGRWPLRGYIGFVRGLLGKPIYPYRVTSLSNEQRTNLYYRAKIGFNMHVSDYSYETGNIRMYETPAHGMMMVCDKAGANAHNKIFTEGKEAIYYDDIEDAISKIEYYLEHDEERIQIAKSGFKRAWNDYGHEQNLKKFLDWAVSVPKK